MRSKMYYIYAVLLFMSMTCISCRQELCYDHYPAMEVGFTWELEWERDYGMDHISSWDASQLHYEYDELRPEVPEWIKMVRYFDGNRVSERFFTPEGARFEVTADEDCSILFYNGDTEYIILSDMASLQNARATATTRTRAGGSIYAMQEYYNASRTTNSPDVIYAAFLEQENGVAVHEVRQLPVKMQPLVYTYLITFEFEYGSNYVALARGALGGMAEGVYLRTGVTTDETSIILFDCDFESNVCYSQVRTFGIPGFPDSYFGRSSLDIDKAFQLNLEVRLKNGKSKEFNFDISDQVRKQPRGGVIKVSGLRVEDSEGKPGAVDGGFNVDISDWGDKQEVNVPIDPK